MRPFLGKDLAPTARRWAYSLTNLTLLGYVRQIVAETAQQAPVTLIAKIVKADTLLLAVEVNYCRKVVRILALVAA